jgi:hypothetical protein
MCFSSLKIKIFSSNSDFLGIKIYLHNKQILIYKKRTIRRDKKRRIRRFE